MGTLSPRALPWARSDALAGRENVKPLTILLTMSQPQAQNVLESAVKNQPKLCRTRWGGCFRGCLITVLVLAVPLWWFCLHTTPLRVSKETTYVLGPMTSDGKRIDHFLAMEEQFYPPELATDDNG